MNIHSLKGAIIALFGFALLASATPAFAYLSPTQVFGGGVLTFSSSSSSTSSPSGTTSSPSAILPPSPRETQYIIYQRQEQSNASRSAAQAAWFASSSSSSLGPIELPGEPDPLTTDAELYDRRMDRLDDEPRTVIIYQNEEPLHSGAPLVTGTGPATVLAVTLLTIAGTLTIAVAWLMQRRTLGLPL